jgi:hypothetical protein
MPERVLQDLDTVLLDMQDVVAGAPRRGASPALPRRSFNRLPAVFRGKGVRLLVKSVVFLLRPTACRIWLQRRSFRPHHGSARCSRPQGSLLGTLRTADANGGVHCHHLPSPVSPIIARDRDAPKHGYLNSNLSACLRYFTGMIIEYRFGITTVINHLCMSVLLVLDAQCTYAGLSGGEYALTVKPGFMGIDGLPNSCMTPVPASTYASSCPGW